MDDESGDDDRDELTSGWEVNWDKNGKADRMKLEVHSKDEVYITRVAQLEWVRGIWLPYQ